MEVNFQKYLLELYKKVYLSKQDPKTRLALSVLVYHEPIIGEMNRNIRRKVSFRCERSTHRAYFEANSKLNVMNGH